MQRVELKLSPKDVGGWLVHHTQRLATTSRVGDFSAVRAAGKSGILLAVLSENDQSTQTIEQVKTLAVAAGIDPRFELNPLLEILEREQLIDVTPTGVEALGLAPSAVLGHVATIFNRESPSACELASISLADYCSQAPRSEARLAQYIGDTHKLSSKEVADLLEDAAHIGFSDREVVGEEHLYFNGSLFRKGALEKTVRVLASLSPAEQRCVREVEDMITGSGCLLEGAVKKVLGDQLFAKLLSIGMYEVSEVSNPQENVKYVMKPAAFCKFGGSPADDAFDMARALVAALTYGMERSSYQRGQILLVDKLVKKLIAGHAVGPAQAIGEDYSILEVKKVIKVIPSHRGFFMRLLKKEIGEIALAAITQGDASEHGLGLSGAALTSFRGPEENRIVARRTLPPKNLDDMLQTLRTGG